MSSRQISSPFDPRTSESYGELRGYLHVAAYSFERSCLVLRQLLSGGGWKQCGDGFVDVDDFLESLQLHQFVKLTEERKEIAQLIKQLRPEVSNRAIGRALGVAHTTVVQRAPAKGKKDSQNNKGVVHSAPFSGFLAAKTVERAERVKNQQAGIAERLTKVGFDAAKLGKSSVILADCPWDDEFGPNRRSTENHYPTMKFEDILELPVADIAHEQAMLFLWATSPMVFMAGQVAARWGFEYRTQMIWVKPSIGTGRYVRQRHEILLVCRRGDHPAPAMENLSDSVIEAPRGEHSAKPGIFHEIIERMYPEATRIELFARSRRPGWVAWGNEVDGAAS